MSNLRNMDRRSFFASANNSSVAALQGSALHGRPGEPSTTSFIDMDGALTYDEAINAIFEIAGRIFGACELALYTVEWDFSTLHLIGSRGVGAQVLINMRKGRIGEVAFSGKEYVAGEAVSAPGSATEDRLSISVPFLLNATPPLFLAV